MQYVKQNGPYFDQTAFDRAAEIILIALCTTAAVYGIAQLCA